MKKIFFLIMIIPMAGITFFLSCKKETSSQGFTGNNKAPVAVAGPDTVITLPTDSVLLNGSKSSDPDGKISAWQWTKLSGPASFTIVSATASITQVSNLTEGVYQFEL
ncbi:MAG: PKD domain-containing protein [Ginsengibacter sp.]